jgi:hypothetical protein
VGESLHDMMLRRMGVQYNPDIVQVLRVTTHPEERIELADGSQLPDEINVMTVRFAIVGHYPDEDTPIRPVRTRTRQRVTEIS